MPGKGYIKIHREIIDHPVFKNALAFRLFIAILVLADRKTGTLATSYAQLGKVVGIWRQHISALLKYLVEYGSITVETDRDNSNKTPTLITVLHFTKWQSGVTPEVTGCNTTGYTGVTPEVTGCNTTGYTGVTPEVTGCNTTGYTPLPYIQEVKQEEYKQEAAAAAPCACACEKSGGAAEDKPQFETFGGTVTEPYPSTPGEVIQEAERQCLMMTDKQASCFLEDFSGVGWVDRYGRRIVNWRCFVRKWLNGWTEREARKKLYGQGNPNASKAGYGVEMDEEERARRRDFQ